MPIIVPIEENHEGIAGLTDAKFRAPDYSGSGLEALGAGLTKFGEGGEQLAGALDDQRKRKLAAIAAIAAAKLDDDHQRNIDDAAVKQAYVDYADNTHEALHGGDGLFRQRGAAAHVAFSDTVGRLVDNHDKALSKLDDVQRAALGPILGARLRSDVDGAAEHVRAEGKAEQQWQAAKLPQAAARDAIANLGDPDLHDHHMATGEKAIAQQGRLKNLPDKEIGRQVADYKSAVHAATIDALIPHDPVHAAGWYARYGDKLNDVDKQRVEAKLGPALDDARAVADVDAASAGDSATAPTNPHAGDDATLLLKMQGITPIMDRAALPSLMQRYGNDPAKAWAAFEAGPETIDRLIAQRGDDWYAGLGDDTRRFVGGNMGMLGRGMASDVAPADPGSGLISITGEPGASNAWLRRASYSPDEAGNFGLHLVGAGGLAADGSVQQPSRMKVFTLLPVKQVHRKKILTAQDKAFLASNYAAASAVARQYHVDVNLLLGVSALESQWATSPQFRDQRNPFGATPNGSDPVTYPSIADAWQAWGRQWGPRIAGVGDDADQFTTRLLRDNRKAVGAVDRRGKYNSKTPAKWKKSVMDTIDSVRRRTAVWDGATL